MGVLLVDDEPSLLEQAKIFLERDYDTLKVRTLTSAQEALSLIEEVNFQAIVSDYKMPEMNGLEFLRVLRKEKELDLPFIMFTGKGREEVAIEALNLGANQYIQKGGEPQSVYGELAHTIIQEVNHYQRKEKVHRSEEKFRKLFQLSPDPTFLINKEGFLERVNQSLCKKLNTNRDEIEGKHIRELDDIFENSIEEVLENFKKRMKNPELPPSTYEIRTGEGEKLQIEINARPLSEDGDSLGLIGIGRDLTHRGEDN